MERIHAHIEVVEYYTMLILNFSINYVQHRLQRPRHRGQTVFSFDQNLTADKDKIKKQVFRENDQNVCKRHFVSNCVVF